MKEKLCRLKSHINNTARKRLIFSVRTPLLRFSMLLSSSTLGGTPVVPDTHRKKSLKTFTKPVARGSCYNCTEATKDAFLVAYDRWICIPAAVISAGRTHVDHFICCYNQLSVFTLGYMVHRNGRSMVYTGSCNWRDAR